jgi:CIC family chloride channel protein
MFVRNSRIIYLEHNFSKGRVRIWFFGIDWFQIAAIVKWPLVTRLLGEPPVLGAVGVAYLVKTFAPEAKGHGVPEVMDAIYYNDGKIRSVVAVIKSLASALSIGSGGSVGREGPIIQIGDAFGSTLGQLIAMPVRQRAILIAAGAGGGIAATFNTPIGGMAFAAELMLPCINPLSLLCVGTASVTATCIGRTICGHTEKSA